MPSLKSEKNLDTHISELMKSARVPGLSIFIAGGGSEGIRAFGVRNLETGAPVDSQTVFEAASLSKPVVAHAALQLADDGKLDLDEPLSRLAGPLVPHDPASATITARHVLSHTTGLPNWRRHDVPLRTYFPPGSRFSYSGEGFVYLQSALERLAGDSLDVIVQRRVFQPLGMRSSSFIWRDSFNDNAAFGHDREGNIDDKFKPDRANAAFSLHTTAGDYGRFVVAAMAGALLSEKAAHLWMEPQLPTPKRRFEALESTPPDTETGVYWGLGWGLEPDVKTFFHWGANPGMTAFVLATPAKRAAFVAFMNGDLGLNIVPGIVEHIMPGQHPALSWLGLSR
jgi:CubicO group peptidase (beta-lactamase class C family)